VQKLKNDYLTSAINTKNSSSIWRSLNTILSRKIQHSTSHDPEAVKNVFSSIYDATAPSVIFPHADTPSAPLLVTEQDVSEVLRNLRKGSPGPDELPFWIFRDFRDILSTAIQHICNLSFSSGIFPDSLKCAHVIPIPKCDKPTISDYRPISLTPILSKVVEKIVLRKWFMPLIHKLGPRQFAFVPRQGQGTITALTYIVNRILSFLDIPGAVRLLMVDYSKAFDKIPFGTILNSLSSMEAPIELVTWVSSYLQTRNQCVKVQGKCSSWFSPTSGVPQGGVLSPILFAIAIDSLEPCSDKSILVKYADDICVLHFIREEQDDSLCAELKHIITWSSEKGLQFNNQKTKVMNFITKRSLSLSPLVDVRTNTVIEEVFSARLLGITIDNKLSWQEHLSNILSKMRRRVYMLYSLKRIKAPPHICWNVYCALLRSIASYGYPAWCNISKSRFQQLTRFEERICKLFGLPAKISFSDFCFRLAQRLALKARDPEHPLHLIHDFQPLRYSTRLGKSSRKVKSLTRRFGDSFIRFA
jgi:hypothetical protein